MQAGLLYETLSGRSGAYVQQLTIACEEQLDGDGIGRAWQSLVRRHGALRTSFTIGESATALQHVHDEVELAVTIADWRELNTREQESRWQQLLLAERQAGFEPGHAPLMRVVVCHLAEERWRMLWSYHHAILDGRSRLALLRELFGRYEGTYPDGADAAPTSPPFEQFARWAAERGQSPGTEMFWRDALAKVEAPTAAPGARGGDGSGDTRAHDGDGGAAIVRTLDGKLSQAVRELAAAHKLTPATILQGTYALLLAQEADSDDVLFATTRAGRRSAPFDTQDMVGLLMVTSPVRLRLQPQESVLEWLARVREFNVSVRDFEHAPLSEMRRWSEIPRPLPIAHTLFSFEAASMNSLLRAADPAWERRDVQLIEQLDFPLTLEAFGDERILLRVMYDRASVPDAEAERVSARYEELLRACVERPLATVASVCELNAEQRRRLSGELDGARPASEQELVPARIREQIAAGPERTAIEHGELRLSYAEMGARVDQLALRLTETGAGPGACVGIAMARTPALICAVLAVHRVGAAYVPLDPRYPAQRLATMLDDSGAAAVLTDARSRAALPESERCAVLVLDEAPGGSEGLRAESQHAQAQRAGTPARARHAAIAPGDLSHLIFTSGSTGRPKAVMVTHRSVAALTAWAQERFTDAQRDGMLASTSLSFDLSVFEILVTLALGGRIVLVENVLALSDPDLAHEIAFVNTVPSALSELLRAVELPSSVHTVALAGEALPATLVERLYARESIDQVWNLYGPSEDTTYSTEYLCMTGQRPLIGRPLPGTQAYVVDRHLRPVPEGVAGELLLGGIGLARGYLNREELTAERFRELTFAQTPATRVYRTGDRARWTSDGQLEYLGRIDNQVKLRGVRVEPDELAHALRAQDSIDDAVAIVSGEGAAGRLVAYVVGAAGRSRPDVQALQAALASSLPSALQPSAIVLLDALPLTPNGKVDRRALPDPPRRTPAGGTAVGAESLTAEAAENPGSQATRQALAEIWVRVLDSDRAATPGGGAASIAPGDDFFALGGDSLKTLHLLVEVEERFGRRLPLATLFSAATLQAQAAAIDAARSQRAASMLIPVRPAGGKTPWMCVLTDHRGVVGLRNLLPARLSDQPVYAMQAIDPALPSWRRSSVEQIAAACVRSLRERYPHGPYRLGGHSMGGLVAFEMARSLTAAGERVELLILLDTLAPELFRWRGRMAARDRMHAGGSLLRRARGQAHLARGALKDTMALMGGERTLRAWPRGFDDPWDQAGAGRIMRRYHPRALAAPVTVLHTPLSTTQGGADLGWARHVTGPLQTRPIPGEHQYIFTEPAVQALAAALAEELERLD
jgi:amino acid adenylation domain-containing protein